MGNRLDYLIPAGLSEHNDSGVGLQDAVRELEVFLQKHPSLQEYQDEIDRRLRCSGTVENRISVISLMMEARVVELYDHLLEFSMRNSLK
jgi:hypothetical protein